MGLRTDEVLLAALKRATRPLSEAERERQRVSFIMGVLPLDSNITRDQVEAVISNHERLSGDEGRVRAR